jgi:hypothetical protein
VPKAKRKRVGKADNFAGKSKSVLAIHVAANKTAMKE